MFNSPFGVQESKADISECEIVFVSDFFSDEYQGGAELTTASIINSSSGVSIAKVKSNLVTKELLSEGIDKYWIFTNFSAMNMELIPAIIANMKYSIVEYDFKYCAYRSPEKHKFETGSDCDCQNQMSGKMISAFYFEADNIFWMSEKQRDHYCSLFPFLDRNNSVVLSSIFNPEFFRNISTLCKNSKSEKYIILDSNSWIKGTQDCIEYCKENSLEFETVSGLSHYELLEKLSMSKGLVFLPKGGDTCPRLVIEAKLLGCKLILNENVMHKDEAWFASDSSGDTLEWIMNGPSRFWDSINRVRNRAHTISGYTTTKNCVEQNYPFEASINSMLGFCDQVVIVDGGSTDGTLEKLMEISKNDDRVVVHEQKRDWDDKRFAVFDGLQKALARALCTGEFCWQQDSDEIVHEKDYEKIKHLVKTVPKSMDLIALPVIEFWGMLGKIRIDATPWKWRLSRNKPHITHGIPGKLRKFDEDGKLFAAPGTDGCDYIRSDSFEPVPFTNFYPAEIDDIRRSAIFGDSEALSNYATWFQNACTSLPSVMHYSWYDIERKIYTYKNYWSKHWQSLYDISQDDTVENNMFFDKPWSEVTDKDIKDMSSKLQDEMGGWIFHEKIDFSRKTACLEIKEDIHPETIKDWIQ